MSMVHLEFDLPEEALAAVRLDQTPFLREFRLAAAIKWYELRQISQTRAAELAGVPRSEFVMALSRHGGSPFQVSADELVGEANGS